MRIARNIEKELSGDDANDRSEAGYNGWALGAAQRMGLPSDGPRSQTQANTSRRNMGSRPNTEKMGSNFHNSIGSSASVNQGSNMRSSNRYRGARQLPYDEWVRRWEEGRCYQCGLAFGPGHKCPEKSLRILVLGDDKNHNFEVDRETGEKLGGEKETASPEGEVEMRWLDLSAFSAGGISQPRTMKLHGSLQEAAVLILINSGASHNFISAELVHRLGLLTGGPISCGVRLGDGQQKMTYGLCSQIEL